MDAREITIVSGLPRSGTSMMMRMLEAGGLPVVTDNLRTADVDNPNGYYEFEKVKQIKKDSSWLPDTRGKVFKMVSLLLYELPDSERYRIVLMRRHIPEILASSRKMEQRLGAKRPGAGEDEMAKIYGKHLAHLEEWLEGQSHMAVLQVSYNDILREPAPIVSQVSRFFDGRLDAEKMAAVVDARLYRQRKD